MRRRRRTRPLAFHSANEDVGPHPPPLMSSLSPSILPATIAVKEQSQTGSPGHRRSPCPGHGPGAQFVVDGSVHTAGDAPLLEHAFGGPARATGATVTPRSGGRPLAFGAGPHDPVDTRRSTAPPI